MKKIVILISADAEWNFIRKKYSPKIYNYNQSPYGDWFQADSKDNKHQLIYFHGGWGKISAAGSTQYIINHFNPKIIINIGTCGGFKGEINKHDIILASKTIIYDIYEQMGNMEDAINHYSINLGINKWEKLLKTRVIKSPILSADKDIRSDEISFLKEKYHAKVADWETGAISYICKVNNINLLILKGVSDLVDNNNGEAYKDIKIFSKGALSVMERLHSLTMEIISKIS